jgi:hypothetical protein
MLATVDTAAAPDTPAAGRAVLVAGDAPVADTPALADTPVVADTVVVEGMRDTAPDTLAAAAEDMTAPVVPTRAPAIAALELTMWWVVDTPVARK